tara:strand:- start:556 stop:2910 length:2355 start_codon:yes stop_codon:yes gene_type:complete
MLFGLISTAHSQNICITPPEDLIWNCGDEDWEYVYTSTAGAIVHTCGDITDQIFQPIALVVEIDTLDCGDISSPNVVQRITRTFFTPAPLQNTGCGLGISCTTQIIEVVDYEPPSFTEFPSDTLVSCENWDLLDYLISGLFQVDFSDNCGIVDQTINLDTVNGSCSAEREFQWEFSLIDACDNMLIDTHFVSVVDTIGPIISFLPPQDLAVSFECKDLVVWPLLSGFDMCSQIDEVIWGDVVEQNLSCPNHWELSRWAYAVDDCGNEDSTQYFIEVLDDVPPTLTYIPLGYSKSCDEIPELELPTAEDGCNGPVMIEIETDTIYALCPQNYTISRTFLATDNCGNESTGIQLIIVNDDEAPTVIAPDGYTTECGGEPILFEEANASDNCDLIPVIDVVVETINNQSSGTYTIESTFTATDACGNSDLAVQYINVEDTTPPYFTNFPSNITIPCSEDYQEEGVTFVDACDPNPVLSDLNIIESFQDCANESVISRVFVIEDDAGNTFSQTQTIDFLDDAPPFFTYLPNDFTVDCALDIVLEDPEYDDLCSPQGMTININDQIENFVCDDTYDLIRYFTITDACGLSATSSQIISVRDVIAPTLETQLDSLFYYCSYDVPDCSETASDLQFSDECGSNEISISCEDVLVEGICEEQACVWNRTYYWEDGCGNQDQANHFIKVEETIFAPEMPTGITPNDDGHNEAYVIRDIGPLIGSGEIAPCNWIPGTLFRVLNRWGQIVFEQENYRNDWTGVDKHGTPLAAGTYFIIFEAEGIAHTTYVDIRRK